MVNKIIDRLIDSYNEEERQQAHQLMNSNAIIYAEKQDQLYALWIKDEQIHGVFVTDRIFIRGDKVDCTCNQRHCIHELVMLLTLAKTNGDFSIFAKPTETQLIQKYVAQLSDLEKTNLLSKYIENDRQYKDKILHFNQSKSQEIYLRSILNTVIEDVKQRDLKDNFDHYDYSLFTVILKMIHEGDFSNEEKYQLNFEVAKEIMSIYSILYIQDRNGFSDFQNDFYKLINMYLVGVYDEDQTTFTKLFNDYMRYLYAFNRDDEQLMNNYLGSDFIFSIGFAFGHVTAFRKEMDDLMANRIEEFKMIYRYEAFESLMKLRTSRYLLALHYGTKAEQELLLKKTLHEKDFFSYLVHQLKRDYSCEYALDVIDFARQQDIYPFPYQQSILILERDCAKEMGYYDKMIKIERDTILCGNLYVLDQYRKHFNIEEWPLERERILADMIKKEFIKPLFEFGIKEKQFDILLPFIKTNIYQAFDHFSYFPPKYHSYLKQEAEVFLKKCFGESRNKSTATTYVPLLRKYYLAFGMNAYEQLSNTLMETCKENLAVVTVLNTNREQRRKEEEKNRVKRLS